MCFFVLAVFYSSVYLGLITVFLNRIPCTEKFQGFPGQPRCLVRYAFALGTVNYPCFLNGIAFVAACAVVFISLIIIVLIASVGIIVYRNYRALTRCVNAQ